MTPEERQMLSALVDRLRSAPAQTIDAEADQVIRQLTVARPDATYMLAQTVLMQDFGLRNAQAQIADLQRQLQAAQQPKSTGSFLGGLFGGPSQTPSASVPPVNPWARPAPQPDYAPYAPSPGYAPVVMQPAQTSGFLRQAATTAAGIAGGALLFEGIQSLFSGHSGFGGYGGGFGGQPGWGGEFGPRESLSETTIVNNNYYDEPAPAHGGGQADYPVDPGGSSGWDQGDSGYQDAVDTGDFSGGGGGGSDDYI